MRVEIKYAALPPLLLPPLPPPTQEGPQPVPPQAVRWGLWLEVRLGLLWGWRGGGNR